VVELGGDDPRHALGVDQLDLAIGSGHTLDEMKWNTSISLGGSRSAQAPSSASQRPDRIAAANAWWSRSGAGRDVATDRY
jgi:hypothetical protein